MEFSLQETAKNLYNMGVSSANPAGEVKIMVAMPIVYTIQGCDACVKLLDKWNADGVEFEERRADLSQDIMEEARSFGDVVPIIRYPDGRVEEGFEGGIGCYIG